MSRTQQKEDFQMASKEAFPGIKLDINKLSKGQEDDVVSVPNN